MTYTKVTYKDRERDRRGQVKSFNDLPIDAQQKFVEIKNYINNYLNRQIDIYMVVIIGDFGTNFQILMLLFVKI